MNLTIRILIGMVAGLTLGMLIQLTGAGPESLIRTFLVDGLLDAGGQIFIASLKLMVVPLVFVSLVCGAASLGGHGNMGRVGGKTVGLYLLTTGIAISIALLLALLIAPGEGASSADITPSEFVPKEAESIKDTLINIFPTNPVAAMAQGNMLQVIVFALLLGVALSRSGEAGTRINALFSDLNEILMKLITMLISLAPYGVFCLMGVLFTKVGWAEIGKLAAYFGTVVLALVLHATIVYPSLLTALARINPLRFFAKMREPMLVAFSTSSSGATLPVTLRTVEKRVGVKNEVASFAVPLGATINMDGTAIMQGVATVFIAQFYLIDLTVADYLMVILTATLASIGTAGVPGVGLIMLAMVLNQVGLPVEGIGLIIGIDRLLDMLRTSVNVVGDGTVATIVARSEDDLDMAVFDDPDAGRVIPKKA
ncbi:MAG: dicarboxylate/amino acid:cation symporter [Gammaproteobacteria bacterium]|nr:MAG: dicarboxylate/amino acid:cation symporter [Gammaproteobacteria bacterium]